MTWMTSRAIPKIQQARSRRFVRSNKESNIQVSGVGAGHVSFAYGRSRPSISLLRRGGVDLLDLLSQSRGQDPLPGRSRLPEQTLPHARLGKGAALRRRSLLPEMPGGLPEDARATASIPDGDPFRLSVRLRTVSGPRAAH